MKRIFVFFAIITFLLTGCTVKEFEPLNETSGRSLSFYASFDEFDQGKTKTFIDERMNLCWTEDDRLSVFAGDICNREYKFNGATGATNGSFSAVSAVEPVCRETINSNYAVYPYDSSHEIVPSGELVVVLPSLQKYAEGSFGLGANTMVAVTEDINKTRLLFKNLCGFLVVKLYGECTVSSITLEGNNGEKISGKARVHAAYGTSPTIEMNEDATTSILLDCGDGVAVGSTAETSSEFWFCVPPTTFDKGFSIKVINQDGEVLTKSISETRTIERNKIYSMSSDEIQFVNPIEKIEREALIALYNATDGDHWTHNDNWCSDKPLEEWYGIKRSKDRVEIIDLMNNNLNGVIPDEIGNLSALKWLLVGNDSTPDVENNHLLNLPASIGKLSNLELFNYSGVGFEGDIPDSYYSLEKLEQLLLCTVQTAKGYRNHINGGLSEKIAGLKSLKILNLSGVGLIGVIPSAIGQLQNLTVFDATFNDLEGNLPESLASLGSLKTLNLYNNKLSGVIPEAVAAHPFFSNWWIDPQQEGYGLTIPMYESIDYSQDGDVTTIQTSSKGQGINIVIMGDGYADIDIASGLYDMWMKKAKDSFFALEPFASFQDYFNVYSIKVVSKNNKFYPGHSSVFGVNIGPSGTPDPSVGHEWICKQYVKKAIDEADIENAIILIVVNEEHNTGNTMEIGPINYDVDYGGGFSIAYVYASPDDMKFTCLVQHEAIGHAFAKFLDEYRVYGPRMTEDERNNIIQRSQYGWYKNIDLTGDPNTVKWARFIKDQRYSSEAIGCYEGAMYDYDIFRPTETSIMREIPGIFNAPSREAIYYKIHKLAYGPEWEYDYEQFVEYDKVNRKE